MRRLAFGSMSRTALLLCLACAGVSVSLGGCGYSMGSLMEEGVHTVAVEIVANPTFRRDLEFRLTEDLKSAILSRTDLRIVDKTRADVVIEGTIVRVREQVLSENRVDDVVESSVVITVDFRARDRRNGSERRVRLTDTAEFLTGRGENVNSATEESFADLSESLVYNLLEKPF